MTPFYLRFADRDEAIELLKAAGLARELPAGQFGHVFDHGVDLIGLSGRPDGTLRDGYFVNWIGEELPKVLEPYKAEPATPFRVFAGWSPEEIAARNAPPPEPLP